MKAEAVAALRAEGHALGHLLACAELKRSTYYYALAHPPRPTRPDVSVNLFFTSFAKQACRSRKGGFTGCANVFSPIPVTA